MPYIILLLSLIFYGLSTTLQKKALQEINLGAMLKIHGWAVGGLYLLGWYLFSKTLNPADYLFPFLAAIASALGFIFYYEALKSTSASVVSLVTSLYSLVAIFLSVIFLGETFLPIYFGAVFFIILGLILLKGKKADKTSFSGIALSLVAMVMWGFWGFFSKAAHNVAGEPELMGAFGLIAILVFPTYAKRFKGEIGSVKGEAIALVSVIILSVASVMFYFSLRFFPASVVTPIISGYPLITIVSSFFILHERLSFRQLLGSAVIIGGIFLFLI